MDELFLKSFTIIHIQYNQGAPNLVHKLHDFLKKLNELNALLWQF